MDGMRAEALEGERGLSLRTGIREGLPHQAQVDRSGCEQPLQQPQLTELGDEGAVDVAGFALLRERPQPFGGEGAQFGTPGGLRWIE